PEAYVARSDTFIEKDASINDEIDKLRHSATSAILERRDVIIVASVSCIYGLGDPEDYRNLALSLRKNMQREREEVIRKLVDMQYDRNDINFVRGTFRVRGDVIDIFPASSSSKAVRIEFFGDEVDRILEIESLTGTIIGEMQHTFIYPASHYATTREKLEVAIENIEAELELRVKEFKDQDKLIEAQRILQRTNYDIEMMREVGYCSGIENYSRHISGRAPGSSPFTLMDFFPDDYLLVIDESHVSIPQVRGMYFGDRARKESLIEYGFRLPSAYDNRPMNFGEFEERINQVICVSATPAQYELQRSSQVVEQIIRPTGLIDPEIQIKPVKGQIDSLIGEVNESVKKQQRVLVTTLTKKMAEDLTEYMKEVGIRVRYLHSDIETMERTKIIRSLRLGEFDVLVGINLLREGLDLPEVALVAILDADKEGFLRSETSLIQTVGRAARNVEGTVIMYADKITDSMRKAINETNRRRKIQIEHNEAHGIEPKSIIKAVRAIIEATTAAEESAKYGGVAASKMRAEDILKVIKAMEDEMKDCAKSMQYERAAELRDKIVELRQKLK
ncbi:MAG TPA: excinuclease ABC subunit UvrB, partial [Methanosarcinales archaeon]|nr:excinuclease ABC subunit UvrB [Methanosarcinales archaeon]